jgi:DNA-binding Lrp family transcriptional regulator
MRGLDDTDREILELLLEDARRPYSDIADRVDLSAPAVSDRVDRLREMGLIRRFTLDVDRTKLRQGVPVLVDVELGPGLGDDARESLAAADGIEHVFATVDDRVVFTATVADGDATSLLTDVLDVDAVRSYDVRLLSGQEWRPDVEAAELAPECAECGNTVTTEGETVTLDGDRYEFCCSSCESQFVDRYERLREGA